MCRINLVLTLALPLTLLQLAVPWTEGAASSIEWEMTVKTAAEEGRLSIYMWRLESLERLAQALQKKYPAIHVSTLGLRGADLGTRLMTERRAGRFLWDVCICGTTTPYRVFYQGKVLDPVRAALILPEVLDESKWWGGKHQYVDPEGRYIFIFLGNVMGDTVSHNTKQVNPSEFVSYWDFLKAKWKAKIVIKDPRTRGPGGGSMRWMYYHPKLGPRFISRLFGEMDITMARDERQAVDWLAKGRFALCFFCSQSELATAKQQGLPVDVFDSSGWREGAGINAQVGSVALINRAPHPNAAKLFINWLLSREGQALYQEYSRDRGASEESLRMDIPKDTIPHKLRRVPGAEYAMVDHAAWMDMEPIYHLINNTLEQVGRRR